MGPNTDGEIRTKSVSNMIRYAYDMKKTINSYDEDGWFKTGDVGHFTDDGCLFIVGRIKELMIYKGLRVTITKSDQSIIYIYIHIIRTV